ncbi:MAG: hypothetical protein ACR2MN_06090 [Acidimicrobiales bacterium]
MAAATRRRRGGRVPGATSTVTKTITSDCRTRPARLGIERCRSCGAAALGCEPLHHPSCRYVEPVRPVTLEVAQ